MSIESIARNAVQTSPSTTQNTQESAKASSTAGSTQTSSASSSSPSSSYTVNISNAAHAALLEATESSAQTQQEANHGDLQAQHLLAKEQAARAQ